MLKVMITAAASNSGKTAVTCGLLSLLKKRGLDPCAFKCGPDYIDPMFYHEILGTPSHNLDSFFCEQDMLCSLLERGSQGAEITVIEGVMGYYDGLTADCDEASSFSIV